MRNKIVHTVFSTALALLLMISSVAPEWIHQFSGHQDTQHTNEVGLQFEGQHHHCAFLTFVPSVFIKVAAIYIPYISDYKTANYQRYSSQAYNRILFHSSLLRGPPSSI